MCKVKENVVTFSNPQNHVFYWLSETVFWVVDATCFPTLLLVAKIAYFHLTCLLREKIFFESFQKIQQSTLQCYNVLHHRKTSWKIVIWECKAIMVSLLSKTFRLICLNFYPGFSRVEHQYKLCWFWSFRNSILWLWQTKTQCEWSLYLFTLCKM